MASRSVPAVTHLIGRRLGRYRLIEPLGRGSQGMVWRALQVEHLVEEVALKVLSTARIHDPRHRVQFHSEAEWGARLASPSLLPTYEFGEAEGFLYLAMPQVEGNSLASVIALRRRRLDARPVTRHWLESLDERRYLRAMTRALARIAQAVDVAHASRVVHRDIKPANILLDRRREDGVYLCDFGLGLDLDDVAPVFLSDSTGTPLFMTPEKLMGSSFDDVRSDLYALGVTLYEAMTLVPPHRVPPDLPQCHWAAYLAHSIPRRPRSVCPLLPDALEDIIMRAMHRDPARRHSSAAELADDLGKIAI